VWSTIRYRMSISLTTHKNQSPHLQGHLCNLFTMNVLAKHDLYDENNHAIFQGQKIHRQKVV
jgi:hypothetical protein